MRSLRICIQCRFASCVNVNRDAARKALCACTVHGDGVAAEPAAEPAAASGVVACDTAVAHPTLAQPSATKFRPSRQSSANSCGSAHADRHSTHDSPEPAHAVRLLEDNSAQAAYEASRRHMTLKLESDTTALESRVSVHAVAPQLVWQALLHRRKAPWSHLYLPCAK